MMLESVSCYLRFTTAAGMSGCAELTNLLRVRMYYVRRRSSIHAGRKPTMEIGEPVPLLKRAMMS